jgi:hypothetical protein
MSLQETNLKYKGLFSELGKAGLNALFPNDFEFYLCAFELRDSKDKLISLFIFPVNPELIKEREPNSVNIMKTFNGVTTISNPTFVPISISISGTFGRKMRILLTSGEVSDSTVFFDTEMLTPSFNPSIKTGYGTLQLMRKLLRKSKSIDKKTGLPYKLYFLNYALNSAYMVEFNEMSYDMTIQKNAIWYYTIQMTAISELKTTRFQRLKNLSLGVAQTSINKLVGSITSTTNDLVNKAKKFN